MLPDPWLKRWLPLVLEGSRNHPVLEIGCGTGDDTVTLAGAGLSVTAFDISRASVAATRRRVPSATVLCRDIREPFPIGDGLAGAVVASLSLHYFPWAETVELIERVHRALRPGGLFLCRLNSTKDEHFGASGNPAIEPNFYSVEGQPKRFFDEESIDQLFSSGWQVLSREHLTTRKYIQQKALWELALRSQRYA